MLDNEKAAPLVSAIPIDRLPTETDAPFGQTELRASVPWDAISTAKRLTARYRADTHSSDNALRVLRFAGIAD
jgi:Tat protein secretion system quality control protein TatD with DNase activity